VEGGETGLVIGSHSFVMVTTPSLRCTSLMMAEKCDISETKMNWNHMIL